MDRDLDSDPEPAIFVLDLQVNYFLKSFYFLKEHLHYFSKVKVQKESQTKIKVQKESQNSRNQGFSYYFCLLMEGSGSGCGAGSGSIPLTYGSGSGRPENMWIRNTAALCKKRLRV
jgi:hypothetical protein